MYPYSLRESALLRQFLSTFTTSRRLTLTPRYSSNAFICSIEMKYPQHQLKESGASTQESGGGHQIEMETAAARKRQQ